MSRARTLASAYSNLNTLSTNATNLNALAPNATTLNAVATRSADTKAGTVSFSLDLQGVLVSAEVSANDTVSVRFQNETGGTVDLGSGVLKALVFKAA